MSNVIRVEIQESDFLPVAGEAAVGEMRGLAGPHLGSIEERSRAILKWLPQVAMNIIQDMSPQGFAVSEMELTLGLDVKAFGTGVQGEVKVTFSK